MSTLPTLPALPTAPTRGNMADWICDVEVFRQELAEHVVSLLDSHPTGDTLAPALTELLAQALGNRAEPLTARVLASGDVELTNEESGDGVVLVREGEHWWLAPHAGGEYARPGDAAGVHTAAADYATGFEWWADPAQMQVMAAALLQQG